MSHTTPLPRPAVAPDTRTEAERNFRWNAAWFVVDFLAFGVGMAFLNQSTVLPTFVSRLTTSALLVGLVATIQSGAWLLPQLLVASLVAGKGRKRLYMIVPAALGRPSFLVLGGFLLFAGSEDRTLLLATLYSALILFGVTDGFCSVPWFDILAKTIPASRRGRLIGTAQTVTGLVGVLIGGVVGYVLGHPALPFPRNYAVLFLAAGTSYVLGVVALSMIREPAGASREERRSLGAFVALVRPALREDGRFARVVAARLIFGAGAMIFPFYIVYSQRVLAFGGEYVGLFLSAQVLGGVLGGIVLGQLADRLGTQVAIRLGIGTAALAPTLGLVTHLAGGALGPALFYATAIIFVAIGVTFSSYQLGFTNYVLEIAPADDRTTYVGLFNTINGALLVVPALAGWLLEATSYLAIFGLALGLMLVAGSISLTLPPVRREV